MARVRYALPSGSESTPALARCYTGVTESRKWRANIEENQDSFFVMLKLIVIIFHTDVTGICLLPGTVFAY